MIDMQSVVELLSAALTIMTIIMAFIVIRHWKKDAINGIKSKEKLTSEQWFIIGVFIGFIGQVLDNTYWLAAWSSHFVDKESLLTSWLFSYGVYFNIPFRQVCGIIAAYCHVRAAVQCAKELNGIVILATLVGVLYSISLVIIK